MGVVLSRVKLSRFYTIGRKMSPLFYKGNESKHTCELDWGFSIKKSFFGFYFLNKIHLYKLRDERELNFKKVLKQVFFFK